MKASVAYLMSSIPNIRQWTYDVSMDKGLKGEYEPKSGWENGDGTVGGYAKSNLANNLEGVSDE